MTDPRMQQHNPETVGSSEAAELGEPVEEMETEMLDGGLQETAGSGGPAATAKVT